MDQARPASSRVGSAIAAAVLCLAGVAGAAPAHAADVRAKLLDDIWPGKKSSSPSRIVALGQRAFFAASSPPTGGALWSTDGTKRGTKLVADIVPGDEGSSPRGLTAAATRVYFTLADPSASGGRRLWQSDGTEAGTRPTPGTDGLDVDSPRAAGDLVFFTVSGPSTGPETWVSDGESPPVRLGTGLYAQPVAALGTTLLGLDGGNGLEPWRTDGTPGGTEELRDIEPGPEGSNPRAFTPLADRVLFIANTGFQTQLWSTDATPAGTSLVTTLPAAFSSRDRAVAWRDRVYFTLSDLQVWGTDGTAEGTAPALEFRSDNSWLFDPVGTTLYLQDGFRLAKTDGTQAGTRRLSRRFSEPSQPVALGPREPALFSARSTRRGFELYQTDGTRRGTKRVRDIRPGRRGSDPSELTPAGNRIVFAASAGRHTGRELWVAKRRR